MTPRRIRLDAAAFEELEAAVVWYEARRPGLGSELLDELDRAIGRVEDDPATFALVPGVQADLGVRRALLRRFSFALVFVELADELRVLALVRTRRRPGYWRERVAA